jgi:peptidoglycan/LPS O-acetylase OafA/YrhL
VIRQVPSNSAALLIDLAHADSTERGYHSLMTITTPRLESQHALTSHAVRHWASIDALRGLAVVAVVLHHIHLRFVLNRFPVKELVPDSVGRVLFWSGYHAVIAFFVISGFLIATHSIRRWGALNRMPIAQFYGLRIARIVPCLLALVAVLAALHTLGVKEYIIKPESGSLGRVVLAALGFHINWYEGVHGYLPGAWDVLWSLSIEETFYILFPLTCLLCRSEKMLVVPALALIVIGPFYRASVTGQGPWEEYAYLSCMDGIAFGILAALIVARVRVRKRALQAGLLIGIMCCVLIITFRQTTTLLKLPDAGLNITVLQLGIALILIAFASDIGNKQFARVTTWLQFAGRSSYEIYLTHMFVVFAGMRLFKLAQAGHFFVWYAGMLLASIALGYCVSKYFSEPLNQAIRSRLGSRSRAVEVAA